MKNWKKASEILPKDKEEILFLNQDEFTCFGWYDKQENLFKEYESMTNYHTGDVIAWCSIPEFDLY